jgi:hypothetical protein
MDESGVFLVDIITHSFSMLTYHLGNEQYARWWLQFRNVFTPHRNDHGHDDHHRRQDADENVWK